MGCAGEDRRSKQFVVVFVHKEFDIDRDIEIERAHRSLPWRIANAESTRGGPRPMHVKFLYFADREYVL